MAQSRVEKFREYRKSIINDDNTPLKTTIESEIKAGAPIEGSPISEEEAAFLKAIYRRERALTTLYFVCVFAIIAVFTIFGILLF